MLPNAVKVNDPCTIYVKFLKEQPKTFILYSVDGDSYFFRYLDGRTPRIKLNIPDPGDYTGNVPFEVYKTTSIELPDKLQTLPPPERDRFKDDPDIVIDDTFDGLAMNDSNNGVVIVGSKWLELPKPMRYFILLHEKYHFFYLTEDYCDLGAMVDFLRSGYNRCTAHYALATVLSRTSENIRRVMRMLENIQYTQTEKL